MRAFFVLALLLATAAGAAETITYTYDARGRLVKVVRTGTVNNNVTTDYVIDKADNRTNVSASVGTPAPPSFSVNDVSASEGAALAFTVTKTGSTSSSFSVNYASSNGTAAAGSDYTAVSGNLTFAPAETSKPVSVSTLTDSLVESVEQMNLNLSGATGGATIGDAVGIGSIADVPPSGPSFSINDVSATEGGNLVFTVTKTGTTSSSFSVNYATANGTALANDYIATSGTLTFTSAQTSRTISVATNADILSGEEDETVLVNLSGATVGATITDSQGVGTIINVCDPNTC